MILYRENYYRPGSEVARKWTQHMKFPGSSLSCEFRVFFYKHYFKITVQKRSTQVSSRWQRLFTRGKIASVNPREEWDRGKS